MLNKRILIVDDNENIHEDFRKALIRKNDQKQYDAMRALILGSDEKKISDNNRPELTYVIDSAYQGEDAVELVRKAVASKQFYAMAFVYIRMPPGWDGLVTIQRMWEIDPEIQCVICTAYSDYSWENMSEQLNDSDNFIILKKPVDVIEVRQLAASLTKKWELKLQIKHTMHHLHDLVAERTRDLEKSLSLLKTTLESTPTGIVVISNDKKISHYNQLFLQFWNVSKELVEKESFNEVVKKLSQQVDDSPLLYEMICNLCIKPMQGKVFEWELKSGKTLELYSHPQYLHDELIGNVLSFIDVTERKAFERQLLHQSTYDSLTKLPNRVLLVDRINQAINSAKRNGSFVGVLFLDLDNFKQINDSLGHLAGDKLLKICGEKLKSCLQENDTVARWGGDEFVIGFIKKCGCCIISS